MLNRVGKIVDSIRYKENYSLICARGCCDFLATNGAGRPHKENQCRYKQS